MTATIALHHNYNSTMLQLQLQPQYTTRHPSVVGEVTTATIATTPTNTNPTTFRSISGFALWITTTNLSYYYRFPILKLPFSWNFPWNKPTILGYPHDYGNPQCHRKSHQNLRPFSTGLTMEHQCDFCTTWTSSSKQPTNLSCVCHPSPSSLSSLLIIPVLVG